jgi:2-polyprenyl-3-methyl-5-hydroxy-6-metoxy-1,4-benzoquinol methylase
MEERAWQQFYLYGKEYEAYLRNFVDVKKEAGVPLTTSDFYAIDIIRPSKNEVLGEFIERNQLENRLNCLDVGSGIGGICRYLADLGHNVIGYDILPHFVEIGTEINSLIGLSDKIHLIAGNILDADLPLESFDLITCLGCLLYLNGEDIMKKLSTLLRPGGVLYIEDYVLRKESPDVNAFLHTSIRTSKDYEQHLAEAGLQIFEFTDRARETSEFAWNRAEKILIRFNQGGSSSDEVQMYAYHCPKILNSIDHLGRENIFERFPNVCRKVGIDTAFSPDKPLTWVILGARKSRV